MPRVKPILLIAGSLQTIFKLGEQRMNHEGLHMVECPKCGGETVEGEVYVNVGVPSVNPAMGGMMSMPGINVGSFETEREDVLKWREKTGEKTGFLIKVDQVRTMAVKGRRCRECGYIEMYAGKET